MLKNGWLRLWLVSTVALMVVVVAVSAYRVWDAPACYGFVSVSIADNVRPQDRELAENLKRDSTTTTFCGESEYSVALTLEDLAHRGVITQIGLQWLEPNGWSFDRSTLDVLNGSEITAQGIADRVSANVYGARFLNVRWLIAGTFIGSLLLLALGFGIAWVRKGFATRDA